MDRATIKKTIETMFLSCPGEDQFPETIITLLEDEYEDCYGRNQAPSPEHRDAKQFRDIQYFSNTGISYFIIGLVKSHERKLKNMSDKSKATLLAIVCRAATEPNTIIPIHEMIARDVVDYIVKQRNSHV